MHTAKLSLVALSIFFLLFSLANAWAISNTPASRRQIVPQPLKLDFEVLNRVGDLSAHEYWSQMQKYRKRSVYGLDIQNHNDISYLLNIYMGADRQKATVVLDTGSSHLWLMQNDTGFGSFNPSTSSSARKTALNYLSGYADGTKSLGLYYEDTFRFFKTDFRGSVTLNDFQFGVVETKATGMAGILGVADRVHEKSPELTNNNLIWALKEAGYIAKASFSLYLNSRTSKYGSVIFGGIDTEKYEDLLAVYPLDTSIGGLAVRVESIDVDGKPFYAKSSYLLDLGTSLGFVSKEVQDHLDELFQPTLVELGGIVYREVGCNQPPNKYFTFDFGSNEVRFSYKDAVSRQGNKCYLGFTYHNGMQILGDIFLRQAYVYFDLSGKTVSIAQAKYTKSSNVIGA